MRIPASWSSHFGNRRWAVEDMWFSAFTIIHHQLLSCLWVLTLLWICWNCLKVASVKRLFFLHCIIYSSLQRLKYIFTGVYSSCKAIGFRLTLLFKFLSNLNSCTPLSLSVEGPLNNEGVKSRNVRLSWHCGITKSVWSAADHCDPGRRGHCPHPHPRFLSGPQDWKRMISLRLLNSNLFDLHLYPGFGW